MMPGDWNPKTQKYVVCPECGSDVFKTRDYDKMLATQVELGYRFKQMSAAHGLAHAEWTLRELQLTESMKYLQRKTKSQANAIRKLEAKLKRLGQQPYEEEKGEVPEITGM